jgi:hypothetical protein
MGVVFNHDQSWLARQSTIDRIREVNNQQASATVCLIYAFERGIPPHHLNSPLTTILIMGMVGRRTEG